MPIGPSTTQTPYIVPDEPNIRFVSILSVGDAVGFKPDGVTPWRMVGIPDGLGAYDNGDGTMTVLMNHEISNTQGVVREHGSIGSFVSRLVVNKTTFEVVSADDLANDVFLNPTGAGFVEGTTAWGRFCSGDLPAASALYNPLTGMGSQDRIYLTGEEFGAEARAFGFVLTGDNARDAYELPALGKFSWENVVANPGTGDKTVVASTDDSTPGQVYLYIGDKTNVGNAVEKAGLTGGITYGVTVSGVRIEDTNTTLTGDTAAFTLTSLGDVSGITGTQLELNSDAAGVTEFFRPEDGQWDPQDPSKFYFVTTANISSNSRLWVLEFSDINNMAAGGTARILLRGDEGHRMLDNMTVSNGTIIMQEDPGNNPRLARVWSYDIATDTLSQIAQHDPARFVAPVAPFTQDEESSGVIDVTDIVDSGPGARTYLLDVQAHYTIADPELVQGGQLMAMIVDAPDTVGTAADDVMNGSFAAETINGFAGADTIQAGSGADIVNGGTGNDTVFGQAGDDTISLGSGANTADGGAGNDRLYGGDGVDRLTGGDGGDLFKAAGGNDVVLGGAGADALYGGLGADTLDGGVGDDRIYGEGGNDAILMGNGIDIAFGGDGSDTFVFRNVNESLGGGDRSTLDQIRDFTVGTDKINLRSIDADTLTPGLQAFTFIGFNAFTGAAGEVRAVALAGSTLIEADVNTDGTPDFAVLLTGNLAITASDFIFV